MTYFVTGIIHCGSNHEDLGTATMAARTKDVAWTSNGITTPKVVVKKINTNKEPRGHLQCP